MTKSDLINIVAKKTGVSKMQAEKAINSFIESLTDGLREEKLVKITGLGSFRVRTRRAREGIDPKTRRRVHLGESMTIGFRPSRLLRERIEGSPSKNNETQQE